MAVEYAILKGGGKLVTFGWDRTGTPPPDPPDPPPLTGRFASPTGTGVGTLADPYSLTAALTKGAVKPGETLYLRGGTYYYSVSRAWDVTGYAVSLQGTADARITVRPYPGEQPIIDGGIRSNDTSGFYPQYVTIRDLEVIVSENLTESRTSSTTSEQGLSPQRPRGGMSFTRGTSVYLVNNYIHDNTVNGIGFWNNVVGASLLYGNVVHSNGYRGTDRTHGHGFYTQNGLGHTDWKYITNNIWYQPYSECGQAYETNSETSYYHFEKNISGRAPSGGISGATNRIVLGRNLQTGWRIYGNRGLQFTLPLLSGNYTSDVICDDNLAYGSFATYDGRGFYNYQFSRNYMYGTLLGFPTAWYAMTEKTGVDWWVPDNRTDWMNNPANPTEAQRCVAYPNLYDETRAHVWACKPGGGSVNVSISGFLSVGDDWELRDPLDLFGTAVQSGTCSGSTIALSLGAYNYLIGVLMKV